MTDLVTEWIMWPWTIRRSDEDGHPTLTIAELPGFVVAAETEAEVEAMFWPALRTFLESYALDGEQPPMPSPNPVTTTITLETADD